MDSNLEIRQIEPEERAAALQLVQDMFMKFEAPEYDEEGVRHFQTFIHDEEQTKQLEMYGAFTGGAVIGVLAMRKQGTHVSLFFVDDAYHRQGIGRALFDHMLRTKKREVITVNAAPYALKIYERLGFVATDTEKTEDGIRYTPMKYVDNK